MKFKVTFSGYVLTEFVRKDIKLLLRISAEVSKIRIELRALILDFREDSLKNDNVFEIRLVQQVHLM